jgi:hypothetical protein
MMLSSLAVLPEADRLFDRPVAYEVSIRAGGARARRSHSARGAGVARWKTLQDFVDDAKNARRNSYGSSGPTARCM